MIFTWLGSFNISAFSSEILSNFTLSIKSRIQCSFKIRAVQGGYYFTLCTNITDRLCSILLDIVAIREAIHPCTCIISGAQFNFLTVSTTPFAKKIARSSLSENNSLFSSLKVAFSFKILFVIYKINLHSLFWNRSYFDNKRHIHVIDD